jgi:hypothetical protein
MQVVRPPRLRPGGVGPSLITARPPALTSWKRPMKLHVEIDLTPDEARRVMGLPDVTKLQEKLTAEMEKRMMAALESASDPEAMLKTWFSWGSQGMEQFQRFMRESQRAPTRDRPPR